MNRKNGLAKVARRAFFGLRTLGRSRPDTHENGHIPLNGSGGENAGKLFDLIEQGAGCPES